VSVDKAIATLKEYQKFKNGESSLCPSPALVNLAIDRIIKYYEEVINPNRVV
jgi:hypothetical protein